MNSTQQSPTPTVAQLIDAARLDCLITSTAHEQGKEPPAARERWLAAYIPGHGTEPLPRDVAAVVAQAVERDRLPRTVGAARSLLRRFVRSHHLI